MGEKRFIVESVMITNDCNEDKRIVKVITDKEEIYSYDDLYEISDLLNEQQDTISQLRTQLLICQQSKKDDGRFQVWEVPPIPKGTRITFSTTTERSDKNE